MRLLLFLLMFFSIAALASSGTTFCPHSYDFKYDKASGMMVAPGGWEFQIGGPAKVTSFVKVEADERDGTIFGCKYNIRVYGQAFQFPAEADDFHYVADNIHVSPWRRGADEMVCVSSAPENCKFHLVN